MRENPERSCSDRRTADTDLWWSERLCMELQEHTESRNWTIHFQHLNASGLDSFSHVQTYSHGSPFCDVFSTVNACTSIQSGGLSSVKFSAKKLNTCLWMIRFFPCCLQSDHVQEQRQLKVLNSLHWNMNQLNKMPSMFQSCDRWLCCR